MLVFYTYYRPVARPSMKSFPYNAVRFVHIIGIAFARDICSKPLYHKHLRQTGAARRAVSPYRATTYKHPWF